MRRSLISEEKHPFRFTREERLKGKDEIRAAFKRGKVVSCHGAKLFVLKNGLPGNRIAVTFARKFGNAVQRNRARRISREAYRLTRNRLNTGFDLALLVYPLEPRPAKSDLRLSDLRSDASRPMPVEPRPDKPAPRLMPRKDSLANRMEQLRILFSRAGLFMENQ
jgi:ribonuclease P protein component